MSPNFYLSLHLTRTSYLPNEILWGHRFESMILYRRDHNNFHINFSAFHGTYEVDTPTCTARMLDELYAKVAPQTFSGVRCLFVSQLVYIYPGEQSSHGPCGNYVQRASRSSS